MGPSGGLMLDGDLLAYSSMAISLFSGLFLVAIHSWDDCGPWTRRVKIDLGALRAYAQAVADQTDSWLAA